MVPVSTPSAPPPSGTAPPPGSAETLDVGGWQVVIADGHAVLPEGMTHLPDHAFLGRTSLVSVACPRSLVSIGDQAFENCSSLVSVTLPATLTSIGDYAFFRCSSLSSVIFPAGLVSIGDGAFVGCSSLARVASPAALTSISRDAFHSCSALTSVTFLASLTSISEQAFSGCFSLTRATVPDTATIGARAFHPATTVLRLPPKRMRALQRWYDAVDGARAYKHCRPLLYGWLERAQIGLGSYGPDGAARKRDREEFEGDFAPLVDSLD